MSAQSEDGKLDWMYKNSDECVDREEYLLGRRLDKNVDSQSTKNETESIPSSIFSLPETTNKVDALRKIKEDPLEAIKEREREMRKELLKNPIRMKKLQKMMEMEKKKTSKNEDSKRNKSKKKKKISKRSEKYDNDNDLDALLSKKLVTLIKKYGKDKIFNFNDEKVKNKSSSSKRTKPESSSDSSESSDSGESSSEDDEQDKVRQMSVRKRHNQIKKGSKNPKQSHKRSSSSESSSDCVEEIKTKKTKSSSSQYQDEPKKSVKNIHNKILNDSRRSSSPKRRKPFGLFIPDGARKARPTSDSNMTHDTNRSRDQSKDRKRSQTRDEPISGSTKSYNRRDRSRSRSKDRIRDKGRKTEMTQEEKEKKLKEMMENVSWRNELMDKNSKRHKEQLKKEEQEHKDYNEDFARNELSKGIYAESVEKRIKSNLHNIQRSSSAMEKNFARR